MTTVHEPVGAIAAGRETPTDDLRRLLRADAALCLISGAVVAAAARPLADLLGVTSTAPILATAGVLAVVGIALVGLATAPRAVLAAGALSAAGDAVWASGSRRWRSSRRSAARAVPWSWPRPRWWRGSGWPSEPASPASLGR
jgi:hypothetical protein